MDEARFWVKLIAGCFVLAVLVAFLVMKLAIEGGSVSMPSLVGMSQNLAESELHQLGLFMKVDQRDFSSTVAADCVLHQDIPAKTQIKRGRVIHVRVSKGPLNVTAPRLAGLTWRQAEILLEQNGLQLGVLDRVYSAGVPEDGVIAQSPEADTTIANGDVVSLLVSLGPEPVRYVMPDFASSNLDLAQAALQQMGLVLQTVNLVAAPQAAQGSVLAQSVQAGTEVDNGTDVSLDVAKGQGGGLAKARFALIQYQVPSDTYGERRVRITVFDALGTRVVHNEMEKPGAAISVPVQAHGKTHYQVMLSGKVVVDQAIP